MIVIPLDEFDFQNNKERKTKMEENSFNGTIITFDELKNAVKEGEVFLTPAEFAKKIKTSEKALRQMRWRSKKGLGRNHYPYYQFGRKSFIR